MSKKNSNPARGQKQSGTGAQRRNGRTLFLQVTVLVIAAAVVASVLGSTIFIK